MNSTSRLVGEGRGRSGFGTMPVDTTSVQATRRIEDLISTMKQGAIMTIDVSAFTSEDLYSENLSLILDPQRIPPHLTPAPPLGAVTFIARKSVPSQNLRDLAIACGREAFPLAKSTGNEVKTGWLFVSDGPWRDANRIVLYQRLWKNHRDLVEAGTNGLKSDEVAIQRHGKIRYAGLLEITDALIDKAIEATRVNTSFAIVFSSRADIVFSESINYIFSHAFTKKNGYEGTSIDWMTLAITLCPRGDVLMRVSGLFDDREAAVDLIATPRNLPKLD